MSAIRDRLPAGGPSRIGPGTAGVSIRATLALQDASEATSGRIAAGGSTCVKRATPLAVACRLH